MQVEGEQVGKVDNALVAGRRYLAEMRPVLAIGSYPGSSPYRRSRAKDGSIAMSGPPQTALVPKPATDTFLGGGYQLTAPAPGSVTFTVTWVQEVTADAGDFECAASAAITLPVFALRRPRVSGARFLRGGYLRRYVAIPAEFRLRVTAPPDPADPAPVLVVLRVRSGIARAPSPRAKPVLRRSLDRLGTFTFRRLVQFYGVSLRRTSNGLTADLVVGAYGWPGRTERFGFSLSVVQGGRVLGGMRGGASCRVRLSVRANRHYSACAPRGFVGRP